MATARSTHKPPRTTGPGPSTRKRPAKDPVRLAVARAYLEFRKGGSFRSEPPQGLEQPQQRGAYVNWLRGLVRHQRLLSDDVERLSAKPLARLDDAPVTLVMLGLLQLRFSDTPQHAVVFETVALAPALGCTHAKGWINALLRRAQREGLHGDALSGAPDEGADGNPLKTLGVRTSHPDWMVARWIAHYGAEQAGEICRANNRFEGSAVRPEYRRISGEALQERLREEGIEATPHPLLNGALWVERLGPLLASPTFREGLCYVQDASSQLAMHWLRPVLSGRVLDACSAPGGKLTHLLGWMPRAGDRIHAAPASAPLPVAADNTLARLAQVRENLKRLRLPKVPLLLADGTHLPFPTADEGGPFRGWDAVLLDAPCSATGMIRKYPELKWRKHEADLTHFTETQQALLREGARVLRPGGHLVYITCSLEPEENEQAVEGFLREHPRFERRSLLTLPAPEGLQNPPESLLNAQGDLRLLPGDTHMGLFAALLVKA